MSLKVLGNIVFCGYLTDSNKGRDSPPVSFRRLLSLSLNGEPSLNGVTPLPAAPDGEGPKSMEDMKAALEKLNQVINTMSHTGKESKRRELFEGISEGVRSNFPELGQILDKFGGAVNGQKPATPGNSDGKELCREVSIVLKDLSHLHWVGAFFTILAVALDRCWKVRKYRDELLKVIENLRDFGNHVLRMHVHVQDSQDSRSLETLQKAVDIICGYATCCGQAAEKKRLWRRFLFANSDQEKLVALQNEINQLYPELALIAIFRVLDNMRYEPACDTFEVTDSTVMVGNAKRVEEALKKLKYYDTTEGVRALIISGMLGTGKSTVGLKVAAELKKSFVKRKLRCAMVVMRSENEEDISVKDKQEELYRQLLKKGAKPEFYNPVSGRGELEDLFKKMKQRDEAALLLFDDVRSYEDLNSLLPDNLGTLLHPKSVLVVTTANSQVTHVLGTPKKGVICISYEVKELEEKEAKNLLLRKIFGDHFFLSSSPLARGLMQSKHFTDLLDFCDGVPLAINVVGSAVWRNGQNYLSDCKLFKEDTLHKLSFDIAYAKLDPSHCEEFLTKLIVSMRHAYIALSQGDPINNTRSHLDRSLEFAYKELKSNRRILDMFLDIVSVHLGRSWEEVELAAADRACGAVDLATLKQLSMVKRLEYKDGTSIVQVHSLLIGLSRKMENLESPGRRLVVKDKLPQYFRNGRCSELNRLELLKVHHCKEIISATQLDLVNSNVRYLELDGTKIQGRCTTLPQNLTFFKSRRSSLPFCPQSLPEFQKLVFLDLDLEKDDTSNLASLQSMPNLERLKLKNSTSLGWIGPKLDRLTTVTIEYCPNFERIEGLNPAAVKHLEIVSCPKFDFSAVSGLLCLERLCLAWFEFPSFPETLVIPSGVRILDLSRNINLRELPKFALDNSVKRMNLQFCRRLPEFRGEMIHCRSLKHLDLGGCEGLEHLSILPDHLPTLQVVDVEGCANVPPSELRQSKEKMQAHNSDFRIIGSTLKDDVRKRDVLADCLAFNPCSKVYFRKSNTLPSAEQLEVQITGSELEDEDDDAQGGCAAFKRWFKSSFKRSHKFVKKLPQRNLKLCFTFPPRHKDKKYL